MPKGRGFRDEYTSGDIYKAKDVIYLFGGMGSPAKQVAIDEVLSMMETRIYVI